MATLPYGRFYGETVAAYRGAGFLVSQTVHEPNLRVEPHRHATPYFCLVISGGFDERSSLGSRFCGATSLLFHPDGHWHEDVLSKNGAVCLNIQLDSGVLPDHGSALISSSGPLSWIATRMFLRFRIGDTSGVREAANELFAKTCVPRRSAPEWLLRAKTTIGKRFAEGLSLAEVADEAGVHPLYLARRFRQHFGCSVGEQLRTTRARAAAAKLVSSEVGIAEVALACGFYDQSHLTNVFKKQTGLTPNEYRQTFQA